MVPRNIGKKYINGINAATCRTRVMILEAAGFPIDWKNVVASITMPSRLYQKKCNLIDFLVVKTDLRKNVIIILGGCRTTANISMLAATVSFLCARRCR